MTKTKDEWIDMMKGAAPKTALSFGAIIFITAISLNFANIDVSTPLNTVMAAKAEAIKAEVLNQSCVDEDLLARIEALESKSHPPN